MHAARRFSGGQGGTQSVNTLLITIHLIACISLIGLVLLQPGQEGMGVVFGGSSSSFFGSSGAGGLLVKLTVFMAVIFFATSLGFTYKQAHRQSTSQEPSSVVLEKEKKEQSDQGKAGQQSQPASGKEGQGRQD
jgi:preprotein translocase subunit SecG